jgi:hypothetical protein
VAAKAALTHILTFSLTSWKHRSASTRKSAERVLQPSALACRCGTGTASKPNDPPYTLLCAAVGACVGVAAGDVAVDVKSHKGCVGIKVLFQIVLQVKSSIIFSSPKSTPSLDFFTVDARSALTVPSRGGWDAAEKRTFFSADGWEAATRGDHGVFLWRPRAVERARHASGCLAIDAAKLTGRNSNSR